MIRDQNTAHIGNRCRHDGRLRGIDPTIRDQTSKTRQARRSPANARLCHAICGDRDVSGVGAFGAGRYMASGGVPR